MEKQNYFGRLYDSARRNLKYAAVAGVLGLTSIVSGTGCANFQPQYLSTDPEAKIVSADGRTNVFPNVYSALTAVRDAGSTNINLTMRRGIGIGDWEINFKDKSPATTNLLAGTISFGTNYLASNTDFNTSVSNAGSTNKTGQNFLQKADFDSDSLSEQEEKRQGYNGLLVDSRGDGKHDWQRANPELYNNLPIEKKIELEQLRIQDSIDHATWYDSEGIKPQTNENYLNSLKNLAEKNKDSKNIPTPVAPVNTSSVPLPPIKSAPSIPLSSTKPAPSIQVKTDPVELTSKRDSKQNVSLDAKIYADENKQKVTLGINVRYGGLKDLANLFRPSCWEHPFGQGGSFCELNPGNYHFRNGIDNNNWTTPAKSFAGKVITAGIVYGISQAGGGSSGSDSGKSEEAAPVKSGGKTQDNDKPALEPIVAPDVPEPVDPIIVPSEPAAPEVPAVQPPAEPSAESPAPEIPVATP